jgi:hypothetical protein
VVRDEPAPAAGRAGEVTARLPETLAWGECLLPAGFRGGFAMGLFAEDGRHLGFVSLLSDEPAPRTATYTGPLRGLRPLLARVLDCLPSLAVVARLGGDAVGGVVLTGTGGCRPVPGLPPHPLLAAGSSVLAVAAEVAGTPGAHASFLSPWADDLLRITVLNCRDESADHLAAVVVVHPAGDLSGLGPRDLRVLGGLLQGWDAERVGTSCAVPSVQRHLDGLTRRLTFASPHALLVHVAREGLYIPPPLWP